MTENSDLTADDARQQLRECECEPIVYDDGSRSHEPECPMYPWCPHEVVAASCSIPCGCPCGPCRALDGGQP